MAKRIAIEVIGRDRAKKDCNIPEIEITEQLSSGRQVEQADVKIYFHLTDKLFPSNGQIISIQRTYYFR